jgi:hypothetical protein
VQIKDDKTKYKRGVEQRYGKPQKKKNQTEILEIKVPFSQTKNTVEGHSSRVKWNKWKTEPQSSKIK